MRGVFGEEVIKGDEAGPYGVEDVVVGEAEDEVHVVEDGGGGSGKDKCQANFYSARGS